MAEIRVGSYVALVDDEDYERISAISWNVRIDRKNLPGLRGWRESAL